jgi:hypothetical protein
MKKKLMPRIAACCVVLSRVLSCSHFHLLALSHTELSSLDRRLLMRKGWEFNIKNAKVGVSAEARLNLVDDAAAGGYVLLLLAPAFAKVGVSAEARLNLVDDAAAGELLPCMLLASLSLRLAQHC